jgi:hypothetical protein
MITFDYSISEIVSDNDSLVLEKMFDDHSGLLSAVFDYLAPISEKKFD